MRFYDPDGTEYGIPTYPKRLAPDGLAAPVRPMTPGRWRAVHAMMRARRTCPDCQVTFNHVIPTSLGCCPGCADSPVALAA
ncbi:hypothetical protein [Streptomyces flavofungini]|uniref:hypothetical protein n=1 Tax=Streptomyces flavofungini TaxID=68200 RepID=UPI0025AFD64B|nr:hypothetical protein [Streptomyces flavofungini]WJV51839.1 hypothetical protein QUY26_40740 [Streptomyces flavofungini]WJV51879.1 hypothetical protein QUY26_40605 [Streptomyces flavofungini]